MHMIPMTPARLAYTISVLVVARYTIRYLLCIALREHGYIVHEAGSDRDGLHLFDRHNPHVVIFEPTTETDALRFIKDLRQKSQAPLMVMSASSNVELRAAALDQGADDFIPASLNTVEVLARLRAIMRRATWMPESASVQVGGMILDTVTRCVCVHNQEIHLTAAEAKLMYLLLTHLGEVVTYQQFMAYTWGQFTKKELNLLRTHMYTLRQKLEAIAPSAVRIITEPQVGYRLHLVAGSDNFSD